MQNTFDQAVSVRIASRNHPEHVRLRLTVRFCFLYFAMFALGLFLCRYTFAGLLPALREEISALFVSPLASCTLARDYVRACLLFARRECMLGILIALSGMTFFSRAASDAALSVHALLFGALSYGAFSAIRTGPMISAHENLAFFLNFFSYLALAAILLATATEAVAFSYEYRDAGRALRTQRDSLGARYTLRTISYIGMLLTVRALLAFLLTVLEGL